jgi:solute carrier family 39 (zinc transporter), member 1/2/3
MIEIKLALLIALLATAFFCGALPLRGRGHAGHAAPRLLEWGNAFTAGIFLGAGFVHMLPDANAAWQQLGWHYPIGMALAAAAIILMLLFEHVLPPEDAHHALHAPSANRFGAHPHVDGSTGPCEDALVGSPRAVYAILTALSIHSLLEGLALGAQRDLRSALVIFAAILAHKSMEGFALGVSLVRGHVPAPRATALLALFASATPVGIVAGATVGALEGSARLACEATFLSLAAGTFAYVATIDILREEFHEPGGRFAKWLWVVAGGGLMALLALWV